MYSQELEAVIQILKQNPSMDLEVIDIQQGRARLETMSNIVQVPPDVICRSVDVENIPAEEIIAPGATEKKVMLYLHGGAYLFGSIKSHREFASR